MAEGHLARYFEPDGLVTGLLPLGFRFNLNGGSPVSYISLGAGVAWTTLVELEEIDRHFNFLLQAGAGLRFPNRENRRWLVELRLVHLSNGNTAGRNLGLNSAALIFGYSIGSAGAGGRKARQSS